MECRILLLRRFRADARDAGIADDALRDAVRLVAGGAGTPLGGFLLKVRVARPGAGKASGFRLLLACRRPDGHVFFIDLFAKNERQTLSPDETRAQREAARRLVELSEAELAPLLASGTLIELEPS